MNLDPGLLAAIIENPADDLPRLQMADWLDEHGECDRAEFIRLQVELAAIQKKAPTVGPPASNEWIPAASRRVKEITAREQELLTTYRLKWTADLPGLPPHTRASEWTTFTRGFVSHITCTSHDWLRHADAITSATPLELVNLTTMPPPLEVHMMQSDCRMRLVRYYNHHGFPDRLCATELNCRDLDYGHYDLGRAADERMYNEFLKICWPRTTFMVPEHLHPFALAVRDLHNAVAAAQLIPPGLLTSP